MNTMRKLGLGLLFIASLTQGVGFNMAYANLNAQQTQQFNQIFQRLATQTMVRANFSQQKKLANMAKTFNSSGQIVFSKAHGVLWQIQAPVRADLIMTPTVVVQKTANTQSKINLTQNQYAGVANIFMQLMSGDQKTLNQHFKVEQISLTSPNWQIHLTPKSATMQKLFAKVEVSGNDFVQKIVINEKAQGKTAGGITTITFSQHKNTPVQLSSYEQTLFQLAK